MLVLPTALVLALPADPATGLMRNAQRESVIRLDRVAHTMPLLEITRLLSKRIVAQRAALRALGLRDDGLLVADRIAHLAATADSKTAAIATESLRRLVADARGQRGEPIELDAGMIDESIGTLLRACIDKRRPAAARADLLSTLTEIGTVIRPTGGWIPVPCALVALQSPNPNLRIAAGRALAAAPYDARPELEAQLSSDPMVRVAAYAAHELCLDGRLDGETPRLVSIWRARLPKKLRADLRECLKEHWEKTSPPKRR